MAGEIKIQELIDVEGAVSSLEKMNTVLRDMVDLFDVKLRKSVQVLNQASPSNSSTLKEANKAMIESEKLLREQIKTEQLKQKVEKESAKIREKELKTAQDKNNIYKQESARLNDLRNAYKNLAAAGKENGIVARGLIQDITKLDAKLKGIDASVGQFQRNVGNYAGAMEGFSHKISDFGKEIALTLTAAFGATSIIDFGKESVEAFLDAEKNANKLSFAVKNIANGSDGAVDMLLKQSAELQEKSIFSDDDIQVAQTALVQYGLTTDAVEKLIPKVIDLATAQGTDLGSATDTVIKALSGQTKGLKEVGLNFDDTGSKTENYNVLLEKLDKFQGAANASLETNAGKLARVKNAWDDVKETVGEWLVNYANQALDSFDILTGKVTNAGNAIKAFSSTFDKMAENFVRGDASQRSVIVANLQNLNKEIKELTAAGDIEKANEKYEIYVELLKRIRKLQLEGKDTKENGNGIVTGNDATKEIDEKIKKGESDLDRIKKEMKFEKEVQDAWRKQDEEMRAKQNKFAEDKFKEEEEERKKKELAFEMENKRRERELKEQEDAAKLRKEQRDKEFEEIRQMTEKTLDLVEREVKRENELKMKAFDEQINARQSAIDVQAKRAAEGLDNTLLFEKEQLENAQLERENLQKKQMRQEKEIAFLKLIAGYAKDDPKGALRKAFIDMALETTIAAAFIEGTENVGQDPQFKGNKYKGGKDGYVARFDGDERIINPEQNRMIGDMSNEQLAKLAHDHRMGKLLPELNMPMLSFADSVNDSIKLHKIVSPLIDEIRDLKSELKRKPVSQLGVDEVGNFVVTNIEDGMKKVVKHIKSKPRI